MEGPFGGPGGGRFEACAAPPSIRGIDIQYESDRSPLIRSLIVEQEYKGRITKTRFGGEMSSFFRIAMDGKEDKVCL